MFVMFGDTVAGGVSGPVCPPPPLTAHPPARPCGTLADLSEDHSRPLFTLVWGPFDPPPRRPLRPQTSSRDTRQDRQLTAAQNLKLGRGLCTSGPKRRLGGVPSWWSTRSATFLPSKWWSSRQTSTPRHDHLMSLAWTVGPNRRRTEEQINNMFAATLWFMSSRLKWMSNSQWVERISWKSLTEDFANRDRLESYLVSLLELSTNINVPQWPHGNKWALKLSDVNQVKLIHLTIFRKNPNEMWMFLAHTAPDAGESRKCSLAIWWRGCMC